MSPRKVLLVDDSKSARYALRLLLQKNDLEVETADSAETALEMIKQSPPDAVFMDHLMPGMNGFEALDAIKGDPQTQHIPVVMCTSNDEEQYQIQAKEKGSLGILPKPADQEKLSLMLDRIEQAIALSASTAMAAAPESEVAEPTAEPAMTQDNMVALVEDRVDAQLTARLETLLNDKLESHLLGLSNELAERLQSESASRLNEWADAESSRLREELSAGLNTDELAAKLETDIKELRAELVKMETDHAQAVVQKLTQEILINHQQFISQQISEEIQASREQLIQEIADSPQLLRRLSETAETAAEHKAMEVASAHAQQIAEDSAEEKAGEMSNFLLQAAADNNKRMMMLATAAAGIGVLSSVIVYFLA
jgi:CheY-like chemotaxis protein